MKDITMLEKENEWLSSDVIGFSPKQQEESKHILCPNKIKLRLFETNLISALCNDNCIHELSNLLDNSIKFENGFIIIPVNNGMIELKYTSTGNH